jgi:hypothetical protein
LRRRKTPTPWSHTRNRMQTPKIKIILTAIFLSSSERLLLLSHNHYQMLSTRKCIYNSAVSCYIVCILKASQITPQKAWGSLSQSGHSSSKGVRLSYFTLIPSHFATPSRLICPTLCWWSWRRHWSFIPFGNFPSEDRARSCVIFLCASEYIIQRLHWVVIKKTRAAMELESSAPSSWSLAIRSCRDLVKGRLQLRKLLS